MVVSGAKERFNAAYNELKWRHVIEKQEDLASLLGTSRPNISAALKGNPTVLTLNFLNRFYEKFKNIFSKEWLLKGEGDMLVDKKEEPTPPSSVDFSSYINALLAKSDETIASLKRELAAKDEIIAAKDERIADLTKLAEERLHRIAELKRTIDANNLSEFPFPIGSAEDGIKPKRKQI
jgi:transcriptional regulator with XRE-family HTH domain